MAKQYRKTAFLIKFTDQTAQLVKSYSFVTSIQVNQPVVDYDDKGNEQVLVKPQTNALHHDYIDAVDIGDSGTIIPINSVIFIKAVKYKEMNGYTQIYTLDNKEFMILK